jgi:hypothetical protein
MIVENIIKEPDRILQLTNLASKDTHRNAKNYVNFKRRLKNYLAFHIILDKDEVVGFGGIYHSDEWPKDLVRIVDRMYQYPSHRFKGLWKKEGKSRDGIKIGLSSETLVPFQTEFCQVRRWKPFFSVEGLHRRNSVKKILDEYVDPQYGYKLLPDMYYTCTNKDKEVLERICWQSIVSITEDIDLPKMSVEEYKKKIHYKSS